MTEKFFRILAYNVIPVVFNGANMSAIAPPHSYINAEDFSSVKQLANYLKMVGRNQSLFASYFWWRDYYQPVVVGGVLVVGVIINYVIFPVQTGVKQSDMV